jgi:hypothetical protein
MKKLFPALVLLSACASQPRRETYEPPLTAPSQTELVQAVPPELFRGDSAGEYRGESAPESVFLDFIFLKNEPADQVPMRVAVYEKKEGSLVRLFVAPTPFAPGDCRRGQCRARIAAMPGGFQISRESLGADRFRADFRLLLEGSDLRLTGKGFQIRRDAAGRENNCAVFYDFAKGRIVRKHGRTGTTESFPGAKPLYLLRDQLRFEEVSPGELCAPGAAPA